MRVSPRAWVRREPLGGVAASGTLVCGVAHPIWPAVADVCCLGCWVERPAFLAGAASSLDENPLGWVATVMLRILFTGVGGSAASRACVVAAIGMPRAPVSFAWAPGQIFGLQPTGVRAAFGSGRWATRGC